MKAITEKLKLTLAVLAVLMQCGMTVNAAPDAGIMETYTGEDFFSVYVKGASKDLTDVSIQIGTATGEIAAAEAITDQDISMRTLVMLDNSLSIKQEDREKIADFLQNLISDRDAGEEMAVTVFGEDITWLAEYTGDYGTLKQAVDGIEYQDQETYLTDVLYELLATEYLADGEDVYRRIIVVSDGVDNKSLGYTKEELYSLLKESPYPVYTIGCVNGKNTEELENMFALSRMTSAQSFLLDDVENTLDITNELKTDRDIVRLEIRPAPEAMDGSRKAVKISYTNQGSTANLSADIMMPQQTQIVVTEPASEPEPELVPEPAPKTEPEAEAYEEDNESAKTVIVIAIFCFVVVAAAVIVIVLLVLRKKRKKVQFETIDDNILQELERSFETADEKTELVRTNIPDDDGRTYMIWNGGNTYHIILTDIHSMARTFQVPLERSVTVGRKQGMCDVILDYEKSVSSKHCEISVKDGKFYIKDLQSANGTYVNGSKVLADTEIFSGNVIKLGRLELKFEVK